MTTGVIATAVTVGDGTGLGALCGGGAEHARAHGRSGLGCGFGWRCVLWLTTPGSEDAGAGGRCRYRD